MSEPRRSSRLKGQTPQEEVSSAEPVAKPARKPTKKRIAEADEQVGESEPVTKKTKGDENEAEESVGDAIVAQPSVEIKSVDIGDVLPSVTLKNQQDEDIDVATLAAEKGVILFLIPKADTPGCTNQACGFRDIYPDFTSHNFDVYCLSADSPKAQDKWKTKKELPYPLISDPKRVLITALGAGEGGKTKRSHFIFEKGGKLIDKKVPVKPADSPKLALEFVKALTPA